MDTNEHGCRKTAFIRKGGEQETNRDLDRRKRRHAKLGTNWKITEIQRHRGGNIRERAAARPHQMNNGEFDRGTGCDKIRVLEEAAPSLNEGGRRCSLINCRMEWWSKGAMECR